MLTNPLSSSPAIRWTYIGCRTSRERNARGTGIETYTHQTPCSLHHRHHIEAGINPSYLCLHPTFPRLYCVHGDGSQVSAFTIGEDGALRASGSHDCLGNNPVHLIVSRSGHWLLVANYASGNIVVLPILANGDIGEVVDCLVLPERAGPHRTQQRGAHPHQLVQHPTANWIAVPDKGGDAIHAISLDERSGKLERIHTTQVAPGSGPRHMVFSDDGTRAWIVLELTSQVLAVNVALMSGLLEPFQRVSTIPDTYTGENTASGIVLIPERNTLHVSNRGHGSVVHYRIDTADGHLHVPHWHDTGGSTPRFLCRIPDSADLLAANEDKDTIVRIRPGSNAAAEVLAHTGSPVCIAFH